MKFYYKRITRIELFTTFAVGAPFLLPGRIYVALRNILFHSRSCFDDCIHILMVIKIHSGLFKAEKE